MTIAFSCPGCQQTYRVPDEVGGRTTKCKKCGTVMTIPQATPEIGFAAAPAAAPPPANWPAAGGDASAPSVKKPRSRIKMFVLIGAMLLLVGGAAYGIYWSVMAIFWPSGLGGDELKFVPDGCQVVASVRVDQILQTEAYKEVTKDVPKVGMDLMAEGFKAMIGVPMDNVERVTAGGTLAGGKPILIIRTKKAVTADEIKTNRQGSFTEAKEGSYTFYEGGGEAFCVAESQLLVAGPADAVKKVLARNKKAELSESMKAALKLVDLNKSVAAAVDLKDFKLPDGPPATPPMGGPAAIGPQNLLNNASSLVKEVEGIGLQLNVAADLRYEVIVLCKDSKVADDYRRIIEGMLVLVKKLAGMMQKDEAITKQTDEFVAGLKFSTSGSRVLVSGSSKVAPYMNLAKDTFFKR